MWSALFGRGSSGLGKVEFAAQGLDTTAQARQTLAVFPKLAYVRRSEAHKDCQMREPRKVRLVELAVVWAIRNPELGPRSARAVYMYSPTRVAARSSGPQIRPCSAGCNLYIVVPLAPRTF